MRTWDDYKAKTIEEDEIGKSILELSEAAAQITGAVYQAREKLGISQRELAKQAKVAQSVVARFEIGETVPRMDTLVKLLSPLGLKLQAVPKEPPMETFVVVNTLDLALATGKAVMIEPSDQDMIWSDSAKEVLVSG